MLICVSGSIKVTCFYGKHKTEYVLNSPDEALYIHHNIWRETYNHSSDAVVLVLSSLEYDENDYIRNYNEFMEGVKCI